MPWPFFQTISPESLSLSGAFSPPPPSLCLPLNPPSWGCYLSSSAPHISFCLCLSLGPLSLSSTRLFLFSNLTPLNFTLLFFISFFFTVYLSPSAILFLTLFPLPLFYFHAALSQWAVYRNHNNPREWGREIEKERPEEILPKFSVHWQRPEEVIYLLGFSLLPPLSPDS